MRSLKVPFFFSMFRDVGEEMVFLVNEVLLEPR